MATFSHSIALEGFESFIAQNLVLVNYCLVKYVFSLWWLRVTAPEVIGPYLHIGQSPVGLSYTEKCQTQMVQDPMIFVRVKSPSVLGISS